MSESGSHGWMPESVGGGLYRAGELMILNGGKLGRYRIVSREGLVDLGGSVRWDDTIMAAVKLVSVKVYLWLDKQRAVSSRLGGRLMGGAHLFVLGRFAGGLGSGWLNVGSEFEDGKWYRVWDRDWASPAGCSCLDYDRNHSLGLGSTVRMGSDVVCKHILAVRMWRMYQNEGEGLKDGVANDRSRSDGDAEADRGTDAPAAQPLG